MQRQLHLLLEDNHYMTMSSRAQAKTPFLWEDLLQKIHLVCATRASTIAWIKPCIHKNYSDVQPSGTIAGTPPTSSTSPLDSKPKEHQLLKVCGLVLNSWRDVCIHLCIPTSKISESEQNYVGNVKLACFAAMLWWLEGNCRWKNRPPTWRVLLDGMKEAGFPDKAKKVEDNIILGMQ